MNVQAAPAVSWTEELASRTVGVEDTGVEAHAIIVMGHARPALAEDLQIVNHALGINCYKVGVV